MADDVDEARITDEGDTSTTDATWREAVELLGRARLTWERLKVRHPRTVTVAIVARLVTEVHLVAQAWADPSWSGELDAFDIAASIMTLARGGRPGHGLSTKIELHRADGTLVSDEDLDLVDRSLRLAFAFVRATGDIIERRPTAASFINRLRRAEGEDEGQRKRLMFLRAVDFASRDPEASTPVIQAMIAGFMRWYDVHAPKHVTPELASECVAAWRKKSGQRGKWARLAAACEELDLGSVGPRDLARAWSEAHPRGGAVRVK